MKIMAFPLSYGYSGIFWPNLEKLWTILWVLEVERHCPAVFRKKLCRQSFLATKSYKHHLTILVNNNKNITYVLAYNISYSFSPPLVRSGQVGQEILVALQNILPVDENLVDFLGRYNFAFSQRQLEHFMDYRHILNIGFFRLDQFVYRPLSFFALSGNCVWRKWNFSFYFFIYCDKRL